MAQYNSTALIVDDHDSSIHFSSGWDPMISSPAEYNSTKTGASSAGLTATFTFTGTGVEVYGSLGSIDVYGQPVSTYNVDGKTSTYTAPIIAPGLAYTHIMFYRSPPLDAGQHTLVITNTNGTSPCVYWLDYIVYTPSSSSDPPPSQPPAPPSSSPDNTPSSTPSKSSQAPPSSTSSPSAAVGSSNTLPSSAISTQSQGSASAASSATSSSGAIPSLSGQALSTSNGVTYTVGVSSEAPPTNTALDASAAAHTQSPTGAIVGGVIGGLAVVILFILGVMMLRRKPRNATRVEDKEDRPAPNNIIPFGSWLPERHREGYPSEKSNRSRTHGLLDLSDAGPSNSGSVPQHSHSNNRSLVATPPNISPGGQHERNHSASTSNPSPLSRHLPPTPSSEYSSSAGSETPLIPAVRETPIIPPANELPHAHARSGSQLRLHQDSGVRLPPPASLIDVPPLYSRE